MPEIPKDQESSQLENLIRKESFDEAFELIKTSDMPDIIKQYNFAYIKFHQGELVDALKVLEQLRYKGLSSPEVNQAIKMVKLELDIEGIELNQSMTDNLIFEVKALPHEFLPTTGVFLLILTGILWVRKQRAVGVICAIFAASLFSTMIYMKDIKVNYNQLEQVVYRGPSKIFEEVQVLPAGVKVIFGKEVKNWKYIQHPEVFRGWINHTEETNL